MSKSADRAVFHPYTELISSPPPQSNSTRTLPDVSSSLPPTSPLPSSLSNSSRLLGEGGPLLQEIRVGSLEFRSVSSVLPVGSDAPLASATLGVVMLVAFIFFDSYTSTWQSAVFSYGGERIRTLTLLTPRTGACR